MHHPDGILALVRGSILTAGSIWVLAVPLSAGAQVDAHEHGHGELNIAVEHDVLAIELRVPAHDVVGFEHTPNSDAERALVKHKLEELADAGRWFLPSKAAGCELHGVSLHLGTIRHTRGEALEHADTHASGHSERYASAADEEKHSDLEGNDLFECSQPERLLELRVRVQSAMPSGAELDAQIITEARQAKVQIDSADVLLKLR